jgi:hypothetical protein
MKIIITKSPLKIFPTKQVKKAPANPKSEAKLKINMMLKIFAQVIKKNSQFLPSLIANSLLTETHFSIKTLFCFQVKIKLVYLFRNKVTKT